MAHGVKQVKGLRTGFRRARPTYTVPFVFLMVTRRVPARRSLRRRGRGRGINRQNAKTPEEGEADLGFYGGAPRASEVLGGATGHGRFRVLNHNHASHRQFPPPELAAKSDPPNLALLSLFWRSGVLAVQTSGSRRACATPNGAVTEWGLGSPRARLRTSRPRTRESPRMIRDARRSR